MTLEVARYLMSASKVAGCKVHFKQLGLRLAKELGVYSTMGKGEHRAKGGNPDQWPKELNVREWPDLNAVQYEEPTEFARAFPRAEWRHFGKRI
jgi:hypothetical protein